MREEETTAHAYKTRTKDHVGLSLQDRLDKLRIFVRIIFQVRILYYDDISGHLLQAQPYRRALTFVFSLEDIFDRTVFLPLDYLLFLIPVVHHQDFLCF